MTDEPAAPPRKPIRWHIAVFLAPAAIVYTILMIVPLLSTLQQSTMTGDLAHRSFIGLGNFMTLFGDPNWSKSFWNALRNNVYFFIINMLVQNPIGIILAALLSNPALRFRAFYRTAIFIPTILSFVIVAFVWKLLLSPLWASRRASSSSSTLANSSSPGSARRSMHSPRSASSRSGNTSASR